VIGTPAFVNKVLEAGVGIIAVWLGAWVLPAQALHVVSDRIPDGTVSVPAGGKAALYLDVNARDFLQWTWNEQSGRNGDLSTQLIWTDTDGQEHEAAALPAGQTFGNFQAPEDLLGARLEWRNAGTTVAKVQWSYYTSAAFWRRPEYFLPALLPLFLLAGAYCVGGLIDRRRRGPAPPARSVRPLPTAIRTETSR
jgi:hypothetical protein